jgi:hypothetical protein
MRKLIHTLVLAVLILAPAAVANAQVNFRIRIGEPPPPVAYRVPPRPGPDYVWVEGYNYPVGGRWVWHDGYWTRPPYPDAYWVEPYYWGGHYYVGHWEGRRGVVRHDHRWDRSERRDEGRRRR